jgi:hypothetical protein
MKGNLPEEPETIVLRVISQELHPDVVNQEAHDDSAMYGFVGYEFMDNVQSISIKELNIFHLEACIPWSELPLSD